MQKIITFNCLNNVQKHLLTFILFFSPLLRQDLCHDMIQK